MYYNYYYYKLSSSFKRFPQKIIQVIPNKSCSVRKPTQEKIYKVLHPFKIAHDPFLQTIRKKSQLL